jgi:hypothetical protein
MSGKDMKMNDMDTNSDYENSKISFLPLDS